MRKKIIVFCVAAIICFTGTLFAQDGQLEATLERNRVSLGNPLYLHVTFSGAQNVNRPEFPGVDGMKIRYVGPSTKMSIVNGQVTQSISHAYLIIPGKAGTFQIGPFSVIHNRHRYVADPVTLVVTGQPSRPGVSSPPAASRGGSTAPSYRGGVSAEKYAGDRVFLEIETSKHRVYVNEILPVEITLYSDNIGIKNIEYPNYSHEGFSSGDFKEPERRWKAIKGISYNALVFKQPLFAIKEGDFVLGPAKLRCNLMVKKTPTRQTSRFSIDEFFGGRFGYNTYPVELESNAVPITILPFPEEGKPSDFQGAVGVFRMDVYPQQTKVKVGDPVTLKITITGDGNFDTVTAPKIPLNDDFKTYEPQVERKGNKKVYEQIFIPKNGEVTELPQVTFSFFNPHSARYEIIQKGPFPIEVAERPVSEQGVKMVSMSGLEQTLYPEEELGEDIVYIKEDIGDIKRKDRLLFKNKLFLVGQLIPLMVFGLFYTAYRKRERMSKDKTYARFMKAPRRARKGLTKAKAYIDNGDISSFYDSVFSTLQNYLSGRFHLSIGNVTVDAVEKQISSKVDSSVIDILKEVFSACEMARYTSSDSMGSVDQAQDVFMKVKKVIDYMEKIR